MNIINGPGGKWGTETAKAAAQAAAAAVMVLRLLLPFSDLQRSIRQLLRATFWICVRKMFLLAFAW